MPFTSMISGNVTANFQVSKGATRWRPSLLGWRPSLRTEQEAKSTGTRSVKTGLTWLPAVSPVFWGEQAKTYDGGLDTKASPIGLQLKTCWMYDVR